MPPEDTTIPVSVEKAPVLEMRDFSNGVNTSANSGLIGPNALRYSINMYNDASHGKVGGLISRYGFDQLDGDSIDVDQAAIDANDEICGLFSYNNVIIVAVDTIGGAVNTYAYNTTSNAWVQIGTTPITFTSGTIMHFARIGDASNSFYTYACNGSTFRSWDGNVSNDWGTDNLSGAPSGMGLIIAFQGRLFVAGRNNNRLHFSNIFDSGLTWDTTNNYIDVAPQTPDGFTAFEKNGTLLLIFKSDSMYTYDGISTQDSPLYEIGSVSQEVIQTFQNATFFVHQNQKQFYVYVYQGSYPTLISDPVKDFLHVDNLSSAYIGVEMGSWNDGENYFLSIGDCEIDDITYQNIVLCYNLKQQSWTILSIAKQTGSQDNFFKYSTRYQESSGNSSPTIFTETNTSNSFYYTIIGGTPLGLTTDDEKCISPVIWSPSSSIGDDVDESTNNPIDILIQTHELEHGSRSRLKTVNKFNVFASGNYGFVTVDMRVDGGEWVSLGGLTGKTTTFSPGLSGYYFEYRIIGSNTGEPFVFEGWDWFDVTIEPYET